MRVEDSLGSRHKASRKIKAHAARYLTELDEGSPHRVLTLADGYYLMETGSSVHTKALN